MITPLSKVIDINFNLTETNKALLTKAATNKQFNTADTDAWFEFGFTDANIQSGTYNLTLINLKDESKFEHEGIAFNSNPFYYKLDSGADMQTNEIKHAGTWIGQLVVTLDNGKTGTQKFVFDIENHILDGTVASVTMLEGYSVLMAQIENAKELLDQYNIDYAALLADLEATYNSRLFSVEQQLAEAATKAELSAIATPLVATLVSQMTNVARIYVYKGAEGGYVNGNWYYHNGTTWVSGGVYQATGLAQNSVIASSISGKVILPEHIEKNAVQVENLSFVTMSQKRKNLFDKSLATTGYYVQNSSGLLVVNASYSASDFILVKAGTTYTVSPTYDQIAFYDKDKKYLSGVAGYQLGVTTFTVPVGAVYVRVTVLNTIKDTYQLEEGISATPFEKYVTSLDDVEVLKNATVKKLKSNVDELIKNPFARTNIKLVGDSITAGYGGTGYSATGEVIGTTGYTANITTATCWANMLKSYLESKFNKDTLVEVSNPNLVIDAHYTSYTISTDTNTLLKWKLRLANNTSANLGVGFTFYGDHFSVIASKVASGGIVDVYVDDVKVGSIDTYNATVVYGTEYSFSGLTLGEHVVKIVETNTKNASATDKLVYIEAFKIPNNVIVSNYGISGRNSAEIYGFRTQIIKNTDDIVIMQLGTNDRHTCIDTAILKAYQRQLIQYAQSLGCEVVVMSANPVSIANDTDVVRNFRMVDVDIAVKQLANEFGLKMISNYDHFIKYCELKNITIDSLLADGLHPNDAGYDVMFRNIMRELNLSIVRDGIS